MTAILTYIKKWIETSSPKQKLIASLFAFSLFATAALMSIGGASSVSQDPLGSTSFYFVSAFLKLIAVLLLIVGSSVIFRRWLQAGPNGKPARQLQLLETIRLTPKQSLHVVMVGDQKFLIGATDQNISLLSPVENSLEPAPVEEATQPQPVFDFGSLLRTLEVSPEKQK